MALPTFSPPQPPTREDGSAPRVATNSRDLISSFGDGYEQRAADGLNALSRSVPLVWAYLSSADADTLCGVFDGYGRAQAFWYTLPWEASQRKFRIGGAASSPLYIRDMGRGITVRVETTFQEVFDLGS